MKTEENKSNVQQDTSRARIKMIKDSWRNQDRISTLPKWGQVQTKIIQECLASLPEIDEETKKKITRNMLLTLRCHSCERARSDECNFSVCIRGLLSGQEVIG
jgi:ribosomal protein L44E